MKVIGGNKAVYDIGDYKTFKELFRNIYYRNMSVNKAEKKTRWIWCNTQFLSAYTLRNEKHIVAKNELLDNVKDFYKGGKKLLK